MKKDELENPQTDSISAVSLGKKRFIAGQKRGKDLNKKWLLLGVVILVVVVGYGYLQNPITPALTMPTLNNNSDTSQVQPTSDTSQVKQTSSSVSSSGSTDGRSSVSAKTTSKVWDNCNWNCN